MAHHFDTELSLKDPRLNICDLYVFDGGADSTVMVITTHGDTGLSAPDTFHPEGLYAFRFDLDGDAKEDVVFTLRFDEPFHADGEHRQALAYRVLRATGSGHLGTSGQQVAAGTTGAVIESTGVKAFVGEVPDLWVADVEGFRATIGNLTTADKVDAGVFGKGKNHFARRNVMALVLETPNDMIGNGRATFGRRSHCTVMHRKCRYAGLESRFSPTSCWPNVPSWSTAPSFQADTKGFRRDHLTPPKNLSVRLLLRRQWTSRPE